MGEAELQARRFDLERLTQPAREVEAYLARFIRQRSLPENLRDAIEYALLGGGKRLRPVLAVRCCQAVGGEVEQALAPAGAIEMIHAFSLVHDDLPAMDDDDLRRGRPTLHRHTSEAMAILAGDALTSLAFELIAEEVQSPDLCCRVLGELARATTDMIAGQVYDTLPSFAEAVEPMDRLQIIHRHKTAALLRAACRMGAMCGGADAGQLESLTRYAEAIGLMFQIVDDLLDVTSTTQALGKAAQKDAQQGKLTYPGLIGVKASRDEVARLHQEALAALGQFDSKADPLRELCDYMAVREH